MTGDENKEVVRRFYRAFEANDIEALNAILAPDLVAYNMHPQNREEHLQGIRGWNSIFSNNRYEIVSQIAEKDQVASYVILRSVHSEGSFQGIPPSGKRIEIPALTLERIKDGQIVERRVFSDRLGMLKQLGLIPTP